MKYNLVMFDFDGTLADSYPWVRSIADEMADKYHVRRVAAHEEDLLRGFSADQILKHFEIPLWKIPQIATHVRQLMAEQIHHVQLFAGIAEMLRQLTDHGAQLAVVSSNAEENIRHVLGSENAALIRYYECGVSVFGKPPKLRKVLAKSQVNPAVAIYIGDEIRDIEAAHAVHIASGAVAWGYNHVESLQAYAPEVMFTSVAEIVEKIV